MTVYETYLNVYLPVAEQYVTQNSDHLSDDLDFETVASALASILHARDGGYSNYSQFIAAILDNDLRRVIQFGDGTMIANIRLLMMGYLNIPAVVTE